MLNLVAYFEFEVQNPENYEKAERTGEATIQVRVEREPETVEEFNEVAKQILRNGKFGKVRILSLFHDDNNAFENLKNTSTSSEDYTLDAIGDSNVVEDLLKAYEEKNSGGKSE